MAGEPMGCLGFLFEIFGLGNGSSAQGTDALPYRQRDAFLSAAELDFFSRAETGRRSALSCLCEGTNF